MGAEYGVDLINIQTIWDYGEAAIALKVSKEFSESARFSLLNVSVNRLLAVMSWYFVRILTTHIEVQHCPYY